MFVPDSLRKVEEAITQVLKEKGFNVDFKIKDYDASGSGDVTYELVGRGSSRVPFEALQIAERFISDWVKVYTPGTACVHAADKS